MLDEDVPISTYYINNYKFVDENINPNSKVIDRKMLVSRLYPDGNVKDTAKKGLNISSVIDLFFKNNYFKPLTERQLCQTLFIKKDVNFVDLSYPDCCAKDVFQPTISSEPIMSTKAFFPFENPTEQEINKTKDIIKQKFDINVDYYKTPASLGHALMHKYGCFDNVFELSGKPAVFITKCAPKVIIASAFNKKQEETGNFVVIDKIGSYTSIYSRFNGIPCGKPKIMTNMDNLNNYSDFYVFLNITNIKCKHSEERFEPLIQLGPNYLSKISFENVQKHYDFDYEFVSGYYFDEGFNTNIRRLANDLFEIRNDLKRNNERIQQVFKLILNTLWGRCVYKPKRTEKKEKDADKLEYMLNKHANFVFSHNKINDSTVRIILSKPLSLDYGIPQFSTNILSYSRSAMNDVYFKAADMNFPIYHSNTDCLLMNRSDAFDLGVIGDNLGDFQVEYDNITYFKVLCGKRFYWEFSDREPRSVNMPN
jgi:hypothetical protein